MAKNFDLQKALAALGEQDWLNPTEPFEGDTEKLDASVPVEEDGRYWLAQASLLIMNNYHVSVRLTASILGVDHRMILRATKLYPELNPAYKEPTDLFEALKNYK